ncbi:ATP-binding cassette sub-family F member 3 [Stemphylium lycopersici]|uniref:ATP-binding cassette sub-family F member 3 n=1 Tax=Stemphylium lycopersici TaxID=183478 RepID=A0A364N4A0_STELY|nr:ATP-binding cassette sub-family F member 3 [Stemphylium lycopersici]RAR11417.1 ATP-binding cassette sub-family F member 3 [Stemphylium lycopersici]
MVSASKAARQAKRAADGDAKPKKTATSKLSSKANSKNASKANSENGDAAEDLELNEEVAKLTTQEDKHGLSDRVTTGVLASLEQSRDVKIISASLVFHGKVLFNDSTLEINYGRRYGLLGENGCGKTTLLKAIDKREFPFPEHIDIYLLNMGAPKTELGALEWVVREAENELARLEKLAEDILEKDGPESPLLDDIYERQEDMDPSTFHTRASLILTGLGFNKTTIHKKTKDMSGGWRMRVALAKALFVKPALLLLDDPTAHLDLEACVWLEEYMKKWDRTLVLVSHSMDFLNGVCTNMIDMRQKKLLYYGGNYDTYHKTRTEQEVNQTKAYEKQQDEIKHIKKFIASAGTYANLVRQAKSRQKILDKMEADGLIEPVAVDRVFTFRFADVEKLPPPVLSLDNVTFSYSGEAKDNLYENLDFGVDMDSRTALVGPNGVGKSTLLNIFTGKLSPTSGVVSRHTHLKLGVYSQHSAEQLDLTKSALDFVRDKFHHISQDLQYWRQQLGRYGMTGEAQTSKMATLSDGQKSRIVFALLAIEGPNMLLLDEPTNGLDIPTIDSLADAINAFSGGVVVVSHDFRLLDKIAKDIMVCEFKTVRRWDGSIGEYKNHLPHLELSLVLNLAPTPPTANKGNYHLNIAAASLLSTDQPLLRMPYELSRRNFKNAQRVIEHSSSALTTSLSATTKAASKKAAPEATLESLDSMITKMQSLKRKLENLHEEESRIHRSAKARLQHLQDLYQVHSLVDVKYDEWSRTRLSRLLVDYLLREGYADSAACLAESKGITDLVDVDAFVACHRIERSLREKMSTTLALEWCKEHGKELKKAGSLLEFELRLQQYIELVRQGHEAGLSGMDGLETEGVSIGGGGGGGEAKLVEARAHAKKYLSPSGDFELTRRAAGMLAYRPWDEVEPYAVISLLAR